VDFYPYFTALEVNPYKYGTKR